MKIFVTYEKCEPSTACGYAVKVTTTYSSFKKQEIDNIEEYLKKNMGAMLIADTDKEASISYAEILHEKWNSAK